MFIPSLKKYYHGNEKMRKELKQTMIGLNVFMKKIGDPDLILAIWKNLLQSGVSISDIAGDFKAKGDSSIIELFRDINLNIINPALKELVTGDIQEQTKQIMNNIAAILKQADMDFTNVVKASIFLVDMNNFDKVNTIYGQFFKENPPARECVQVSKLPKNVDIEISVIAVK